LAQEVQALGGAAAHRCEPSPAAVAVTVAVSSLICQGVGWPGYHLVSVSSEPYIPVVTLGDVTRAGVLAAVEQFDQQGRETFLKLNNFGRATGYFLEHDGKLYDSKAISGYAHKVSTGVPLEAGAFTGGDATVAHRLQVLGFTVLNLHRPDWTHDELILACELAEKNDWRQVYDSDPRAKELSRLLQSPANHPHHWPRHPDFRNPSGVGQKTRNIIDWHPDNLRPDKTKSNGGQLDPVVLHEYLDDPARGRVQAARIREVFAAADASTIAVPDLDLPDPGTGEGGVVLRAYLRRERDPKLRRRMLEYMKKHGRPIVCEACGFDYAETYGEHGQDYIECHHRIPLHVTGETKTRLSDLALLCSNCHRMVHRSKRWLTVEELKQLVDAQRQKFANDPASVTG
jgi:5-methylcytosine-specific restriction enzyme A